MLFLCGKRGDGRVKEQTSLQPGDRLGERYRIIGRIGQGGAGYVYLAEDMRLPGARWAVKEIADPPGDGAEQERNRSLAEEEARLLSVLRHPRLPRMADWIRPPGEGRAYLVMEYIEGLTLSDWLNECGGCLPGEEIAEIGMELLEVLDYLHRQRPPVIYRDIKPSNLMLTPDRGVMLIDFGAARSFKAGAGDDTVKLGTVGFAAPEQYTGGQTDARSDLYGLGALLLYLSTGGQYSQWSGGMERRLAGRLPQGWIPVLRRLLRHRPEDRFQSAAEVMAAAGSLRSRPFRAADREAGRKAAERMAGGHAEADNIRTCAAEVSGRRSLRSLLRGDAAGGNPAGANPSWINPAGGRTDSAEARFSRAEGRSSDGCRPRKAANAAHGEPLRIGLLGAAPGIGVTHASLAMAALLSRRGSTLWVDDRPESAVLRVIAEWAAGDDLPPPEQAGPVPGPVRLGGVDYACRGGHRGGLPPDDGYAFTVVDLGSAPGEAAPGTEGRIGECGLQILLAPAADWRIGESLRWLRRRLAPAGTPGAGRQAVALPLGTPQAAALLRRALGVPVLPLPCQSDPFRRGGELEAALARLLRPAIGRASCRRSGEWQQS